MGMYNECFKRCVKCGVQNEIQISQVVLGFGGFDLDDPPDLAEKLNESELRKLRSIVEDEYFRCRSCGYDYSAINGKASSSELAEELFPR